MLDLLELKWKKTLKEKETKIIIPYLWFCVIHDLIKILTKPYFKVASLILHLTDLFFLRKYLLQCSVTWV